MERKAIATLLFLSCFLHLIHPSTASNNGTNDELNVYIVTVKDRDGAEIGQHEHTESWHNSLLSTVIPNYSSRLVYSYHSVINGFAARLTKLEVDTISKQDWFIQAIPSGTYKLITTHSPAFLGLHSPKEDPTGVWSATNMGEGIIIGVLDSGIVPGHPSFRDEGLPPPPAKWKGHCDFNVSVCNNKLIGARSILQASGEVGHNPPFDMDGHGTHVSSIAAGAFVKHAGAVGNAEGTASGIAPRAHLAFYQTCIGHEECHGADILKAIETAVDDGVDVLSISFVATNFQENTSLSTNAVLVGSFYAMSRGVFVSAGVGNIGPQFGTIDNDIPWLLSVGGTSTDRRMSSILELGNRVNIDGEVLLQPKNWSQNMVPIIYLGYCKGEVDKHKVQGKIIVCDNNKYQYDEDLLSEASVVGIIILNDKVRGYSSVKTSQVTPIMMYVSYVDGVKIREYIRSTANASANFYFKGAVMNSPRSPAVASFSSRGPSNRFPRILKPDIVGPGDDIVAAIPPEVIDELIGGPNNYSKFIFMSGTSMSAPHLAGVAALIKKIHPNWSPSAIKSAIMTTSYITDNGGKRITDERGLSANFYSLGAGHVDPTRAIDPGLVYDVEPHKYISLLCGLGLTDTEVNTIIYPSPSVKCSQMKKISQEELNYPSIVATLNFKSTVVIKRTVKNVGDANSTYNASIDVPSGISARVSPATLRFNKINEQRSFTVAFTWEGGKSSYAEGQLRWISTKYVVRSPIVINKASPNGSILLPY